MARARIGSNNIDMVDYSYEMQVLKQKRLDQQAQNQQLLQSGASLGMNAWRYWSDEQSMQVQEKLAKVYTEGPHEGKSMFELNPSYEDAGFFKRVTTPAKDRTRKVEYKPEPTKVDPTKGASDPSVSGTAPSPSAAPVSDANSIYDPTHPSYDAIASKELINDNMPGFLSGDPVDDPTAYSDVAFKGTDVVDLSDPQVFDSTGPSIGSDEWFAQYQAGNKAAIAREQHKAFGESVFGQSDASRIKDPTEYSDTVFDTSGDIDLSDSVPVDRGDVSLNPDATQGMPSADKYPTIDAFLEDKSRAMNEFQTAEVQRQIERGIKMKENAYNIGDSPELEGIPTNNISQETIDIVDDINVELSGGTVPTTRASDVIEPTGNLSLRNAFQPKGGINLDNVPSAVDPQPYYGDSVEESINPLIDKFNQIEGQIDAGEITNMKDLNVAIDPNYKPETIPGIPGASTVPSDVGPDFEGGTSLWQNQIASNVQALRNNREVGRMAEGVASGDITDIDITDIVGKVDENLAGEAAGEAAKEAGGSALGKAVSWGGAALSAYDMATNWDEMDDGERIMSAASTGTSIAAAMGLINPAWGIGLGILQGGIQANKRGWA